MSSASDTHEIHIIEDNPENAEALRDIVLSMGMRFRISTTLEEAREALATFEPCAVLQDMQLPHAADARPHESSGESCIQLVRRRSSGKWRVPILVVTSFRSDPDYVWRMAELDADAFIAKKNIEALPEKLLAYLKKNGRESHASCARCNVDSRPADAAPQPAGEARVFTHDHIRGVSVDAAALRALYDRRAEHDLFLDYATVDPRGHLAGYRDHRGVFRESFLGETSAAILAELVSLRKTIRAEALERLRKGGQSSAVRQVQLARKAVDVRRVVRGVESRTEWRAFHTVGGKGATAFVFEPPAGMTYAVITTSVRETQLRQLDNRA